MSPGAGGTTAAPWPTSLATTSCHPVWGLDDTATSSCLRGVSLPWRWWGQVIVVIRFCTQGSLQSWVSSDAGPVGEQHNRRQQVYLHPSDLLLMTHGLRVWVAMGTGTGKPKTTRGLPMPLPKQDVIIDGGHCKAWGVGAELETMMNMECENESENDHFCKIKGDAWFFKNGHFSAYSGLILKFILEKWDWGWGKKWAKNAPKMATVNNSISLSQPVAQIPLLSQTDVIWLTIFMPNWIRMTQMFTNRTLDPSHWIRIEILTEFDHWIM